MTSTLSGSEIRVIEAAAPPMRFARAWHCLGRADSFARTPDLTGRALQRGCNGMRESIDKAVRAGRIEVPGE
ncbi:hypothetical protein GCM10009609_33430 [Pseudonocardia aurantiaca]|uniref:Uncharacterized protein n=1 Tax=Pseudonocardia aurantiaca TaxID=75290 RepID=A0ABW4FR84_9PSEU